MRVDGFSSRLSIVPATRRKQSHVMSEDRIFRMNRNLSEFSPDGLFLAIGNQTNLVVKVTATLETFQSFVFDGAGSGSDGYIESMKWSPNGEFVLCANARKAVVQIFRVCRSDWRFKLMEGCHGLEFASWAPDSRHVLTMADFDIELSVWSLEEKSRISIQNLKSSANKNTHFSPDGKRLAVVVTEDGDDTVEIYKTSNWKISRKLICERLDGIDDLRWSPNGELLCIWCSTVGISRLIVYSTASESHVGTFSPEKVTTSATTAPGDSPDHEKRLIGIAGVTWSPCGQILAVSGYNEMVVLLNYLTWSPIQRIHLDPVVPNGDYFHKVYKEVSVDPSDTDTKRHRIKEFLERPVNLPLSKPEYRNEQLVIPEIDILEFSYCGRYLAIRHQVFPTTVWVWDVIGDNIDYLILRNNVSGLQWDPNGTRLVVATERAFVFLWSPEKVECLETPKGITVLNACWGPRSDQKLLLLRGYNKTAVMHV